MDYSDYVVLPGEPPPNDGCVREAMADGASELEVTYEIDGNAIPSFGFGFFLSNDSVLDADDTQVDTATIADPAERVRRLAYQGVRNRYGTWAPSTNNVAFRSAKGDKTAVLFLDRYLARLPCPGAAPPTVRTTSWS